EVARLRGSVFPQGKLLHLLDLLHGLNPVVEAALEFCVLHCVVPPSKGLDRKSAIVGFVGILLIKGGVLGLEGLTVQPLLYNILPCDNVLACVPASFSPSICLSWFSACCFCSVRSLICWQAVSYCWISCSAR